MDPTPRQLAALGRRDPALGRVMKRLPAFPGFPHGRPSQSHFHAIARSILFQQVTTHVGRVIHGRMCELTPGPRFPRPADVLVLGDELLRSAGLSRNKATSILDLAERVEDGRLRMRAIGRLPDQEIIERLVEVRGVGVWTAQMFLIFRLGRLDVMPVGDLGVQEGVLRLDGLAERPTPVQLEERARVWEPLRSVGAWFMWRLSEGRR